MKRVLFICTGNYYRSRYAEAFFNYRSMLDGLPFEAFSRGLAPHLVEGDLPLSPWVTQALHHRGIPIEMTGSRRALLTAADLESAHFIVALKEKEHRPLMEASFPDWVGRIAYWTVHDIDVARPEETLPFIEAQVEQFMASLMRGTDRASVKIACGEKATIGESNKANDPKVSRF